MFRFERRLRRRDLLWGEASEGGRSPPPSYLAPVILGNHLLGGYTELIEHAV